MIKKEYSGSPLRKQQINIDSTSFLIETSIS